MSRSIALQPVCSNSSTYVAAIIAPAQTTSRALQPLCQISGQTQTATPKPAT